MQFAKALALDDSPEYLAYTAITDVMTSDPTLKRIGTSFRVWAGGEGDHAEPASDVAPSVWLDVDAGDSRWSEESEHRCHVHVRIGIVSPGSSIRDFWNLGHAIRRALWPTDATQLAAVRTKIGATIHRGELIGGWSRKAVENDSGVWAQAGEAVLKLVVTVDT